VFRSLARTISTKALVTSSVLVLGIAVAACLYFLDRAHNRLISSLEAAHEFGASIDVSRKAQVHFKKQVQEWKNVLLRGYEPTLFEKYLKQFRGEEVATRDALGELRRLRPQLAKSVNQMLAEHQVLSQRYRKALAELDPTDVQSQRRVDEQVRGIDRPLTDRMDEMVQRIDNQMIFSLAEIKEASALENRAVQSSIFATLVLSLGGVMLLIAAAIGRERSAAESRLQQIQSEFRTMEQAKEEIERLNLLLKESHAALEERVSERTLELVTANRELKQQIAQREHAQNELRTTQAQLERAQKLEAIGRLAGGIAHDFNNILSVILTYTDLVARELNGQSELRADLAEIRGAGERARDLTRQLLAFSRQQVLVPKVFDLNAVVESAHRMLNRIIGEDIELIIELSSEPICIKADRGQLEQIILNLTVNARDAMPNGGKLVISTGSVMNTSDEFGEPTSSRSYAVLTVRDSGIGMDEATQAQAFEPFFTTKPRSEGTGLGLPTVFGIVQQSGGFISVESEVGLGTTFRVLLPASSEVLAAPTPSETPRAPRSAGSETILVVEDEAHVRAVACRVLRQQGYRVIEAEGPEEALALIDTHLMPSIDLMLTDLVMPKLGGRALAERVRALLPNVRVVFMSGYTDDAVFRSNAGSGLGAFIQKPFTASDLLRMVRSVLDTASPPDSESRSGTNTQDAHARPSNVTEAIPKQWMHRLQ